MVPRPAPREKEASLGSGANRRSVGIGERGHSAVVAELLAQSLRRECTLRVQRFHPVQGTRLPGLHTPAPSGTRTSYRRMLDEMQGKRGVFAETSWDGKALEAPYVPPWRMTVFDTYGAEAAKAMKAPVESVEKRASCFAQEEHARRTFGSTRVKMAEALSG